MTDRPPQHPPPQNPARAPVTNDDLHAFADGALTPARTREVASYLATHPDAAAFVAEIRATNRLLQLGAERRAAAFGREEEIPERLLDGARQLADALRRRREPGSK